MTEVPTAAPAQQAEETDAEKVVRAQHIIDALRRRLTDATEECVGLESRIAMLENQLAQESQIRLSMASEISRLRALLPEESESLPDPTEGDPDNLEADKSDDSTADA